MIRDAYDKATKKPADFVERFARHKSKSIVSWAEAREKNDFSIFRDDLAEMIELNRELAGYLGYEENPYDALLDIYESGLCVSQVDPLFAGLREALVPLISAVGKCDAPDMNWVESNHWPEEAQAQLSHGISAAVGFDFEAGRRDKSTHPFCGGSNPDDVRWTTRYDEAEPFGSLYGSLYMKPATVCMNKVAHAILISNPQVMPTVLEFTNPKVGCGRIKWGVLSPLANGRFHTGPSIFHKTWRVSLVRCYGAV